MKLEMLNASVVVLANDHNPSILHPEFLTRAKIVPEEWEASEVVCTQPVSFVKYNAGTLVFTVDSSKVQIVDSSLALQMDKTTIAEMAKSYITNLPHVRYRAVGVNFNSFVECADSEQWIIRRFLKDAEWMKAFVPEAMGLRMLFPILNKTTLRLGIDGGTMKRPKEEAKKGLLIGANCHTEVTNLQHACDELSLFLDKFNEFASRATKILETKDGGN